MSPLTRISMTRMHAKCSGIVQPKTARCVQARRRLGLQCRSVDCTPLVQPCAGRHVVKVYQQSRERGCIVCLKNGMSIDGQHWWLSCNRNTLGYILQLDLLTRQTKMSLANISNEHRPKSVKKRKAFAVLVTTMDAELEFNIEVNIIYCGQLHTCI